MRKNILFYFLILVVIACSRSVSDEVYPQQQSANEASYSEENGALSFSTTSVFKQFIENYQEKEQEITDFYKDGFVPYRPLSNLDQQTSLQLIQSKKLIIQKENISFSHLRKNTKNGEYDDFPNGEGKVLSSALFSYPKIKSIDLNIETGALYGGKWGGTKLTVIYND